LVEFQKLKEQRLCLVVMALSVMQHTQVVYGEDQRKLIVTCPRFMYQEL
jgi:hypothetical protein